MEENNLKLHEKRSTILIAIFENDFAAGWKMAVGKHFKTSLDIRRTSLVYEKQTCFLWTQGNFYNFKVGATIYDSRNAYQSVWSESLKHINLGVQIIDAKPVEIKKGKTRYPGEVVFQVLRPSENCQSLRRHETIRTTQDEFVTFLQTGSVRPFTIGKSEARNLSKDVLQLC